MDTKQCRKCKELVPLVLFTKKSAAKDGYASWCKKCMCDHNKARYANNESVRLARKEYDSYNRQAYVRHHLTNEQYQNLVSKNDGICPICNIDKAYVIDHDHNCCPGNFSCGRCVRGLLCLHCNWLLGDAKDSVSTLSNAIEYLSR